MALRSLKLRKQIDLVNKQLEELRTKAEALAVRDRKSHTSELQSR